MNLIIAWLSLFVLFALCIFVLVKARKWLNLKTDKEYRGFLTFVGVMFVLMLSVSTFIYVKLNPEIFEGNPISSF